MRPRKLRILVVDDEAAMREVLEMRLGEWGYEVGLAGDGREAATRVLELRPDAVISDVVLPDVSGLELVRKLQQGDPVRPVVLITAYGTIDTAVEAMKLGAFDFLTKPLDYQKLRATLVAAEGELERRLHARSLGRRLDRGGGLGLLVGSSPPMRQLYEQLEVLAASDATAILTGASGTGKELAARTIHELSGRRDGPFVAVNAAAVPEGLIERELFGHEKGAFTSAGTARPGYFELADRGTLFLDEIGEMPPVLQPKLLRVLEDGKVRRVGGGRERQVHVRVLAATNQDPRAAIDEGRIREDLYYRLSVFTLELPPLAKRRGDVELLCQHFIRELNDKHGASVEGVGREAAERLRAYGWPGNVRELRNVIERAVILAGSGWIESIHLPPYLRDSEAEGDGILVPHGASAAEAERIVILETLKRVGNNKSRAARELGLDVKTVRSKLRSYGVGKERR